MRVHLRLNPAKEEERLITRWLARYHRGATRHAVIKACLAAGARAFLLEGLARKTIPAPTTAIPTTAPNPVSIPSFTNLGQLVKTQTVTPSLTDTAHPTRRTPPS
ncbi:MAG: hypothetical protein ABL983_09880 [Nitrospira sp.]